MASPHDTHNHLHRRLIVGPQKLRNHQQRSSILRQRPQQRVQLLRPTKMYKGIDCPFIINTSRALADLGNQLFEGGVFEFQLEM